MITTQSIRRAAALALPIALLASCAEPTCACKPDPGDPSAPQDSFMSALASHCGKAFAGKLVSEDEAEAIRQYVLSEANRIYQLQQAGEG